MRRKVSASKRIAQEVLAGYVGRVVRREHLGVIEDSAISFQDASSQWLGSLRADIRSTSRVRFESAVRLHLVPFFTGHLRSIKPEMVRQFVAARVAEGAGNATINTELTALKMILRWAVKEKLLAHNPLLDSQGRPLEGTKQLQPPPGRVRYLSSEEIDRLLPACAAVPCMKEFTLVALNSGMRRNEILSLTRTSVDFVNRLVRLLDTKNRKPRAVYLNNVALAALRALPHRMDGRLWPFSSPNQVSMLFVRAARRAGIADCHLHDCRHTFLSYRPSQRQWAHPHGTGRP